MCQLCLMCLLYSWVVHPFSTSRRQVLRRRPRVLVRTGQVREVLPRCGVWRVRVRERLLPPAGDGEGGEEEEVGGGVRTRAALL